VSLDVYLEETTQFFNGNITHNLGEMAHQAGLYDVLWRPDEIYHFHAYQLIPSLEKGLALLKSDPERFKKFDSPNGWGLYDNFVPFVENYLEACKKNPNAEVRVSR
jgi:hypothetical protein